MSKFTPDKWEVDDEGVVFNREEGINIGTLYPYNREANALLIASAPEMYELLKEIKQLLFDLTAFTDDEGDTMDVFIGLIKDIIKKIDGDTP